MEKVAVVLLNYLNFEDTIECVESLKNDNYKNKEIIIVDNGSNNESWKILNDKYKNSDVIHLIKSNINLGFASGNNLGIDYARKKLNCNFILLANNDTIFKDYNCISILMSAYEKGIGIIGPKIIEKNGYDQNPIQTLVTEESIEKDLGYLFSYKYKIKNSCIYKKMKENSMLRKFKKNTIDKAAPNKLLDNENSIDLVLHGACMLLTRCYFKYYPRLLPNTFLYYEENILTLITAKVGLRKKFIKDTFIYHKEDQSSNMSFGNKHSIRKKYLLDSINICKSIYNLRYEELIEDYFKEE